MVKTLPLGSRCFNHDDRELRLRIVAPGPQPARGRGAGRPIDTRGLGAALRIRRRGRRGSRRGRGGRSRTRSPTQRALGFLGALQCVVQTVLSLAIGRPVGVSHRAIRVTHGLGRIGNCLVELGASVTGNGGLTGLRVSAVSGRCR